MRSGRRPRASDAADFIVVGSGAGGATCALALAEAGRSVILVEEGPRVRLEDRGLATSEAFARLFRDRGTQVAMGRSVIPILQGRCVGGTTVVNGAIVWRLPEDAYDRVFRAVGADDDIPLAELERRFDRIERDLSVAAATQALLGNNGRLMQKAAHAMGFEGHPIRRNVKDCRGSAHCLEACPSQQKQSLEVTYVPAAEKLGARVVSDHEVRTIEVRGARALGVRGRDARGEPFLFEARRAVVIAASAIQSPCILKRSGLGGAHVGKHFRAHPGTAVSGVYDDEVRIWEGATQSYEVDHFRSEGFKMETVSLPLELAGVRMAGIGQDFQRAIADYPKMAVWGAQIRADAEGTVSPGFDSTPASGGAGSTARIAFTPTERDMLLFRRAVRTLSEMHFAAGARRVYPGVHGGPYELTSTADLAKLDDLPIDPRAYSLIAAHLFSTCRMGNDPRTSVVGTDFGVHGVSGLYVVDASVFPTNLGVNPQHAIMALAMLAGERIAESAPQP